MQTPRRQALLATLAGILAGVTVLGVVVVIRGITGPSQTAASSSTPSTPAPSTPTGTPNPDDALDAGQLTFVRKTVGDGIVVEIPEGWQAGQPSDNQIRHVDASDTWLVRVDGRAQKRSVAQMLAARERGVRKSADFMAVRRDRGHQQVSWNAGGLEHRTLVYTYTNDSGEDRMVMSRWISVDGGARTAVEITVGGRPKDETGLADLLTKVTESLVLPS